MIFTIHFCHKPKSPESEPECFSSPDIQAEGLFEAREAAFDAGNKLGADWMILSDASRKDLETWSLSNSKWEQVHA